MRRAIPRSCAFFGDAWRRNPNSNSKVKCKGDIQLKLGDILAKKGSLWIHLSTDLAQICLQRVIICFAAASLRLKWIKKVAFEEDQKYKVRGSVFFLVLLIFVFPRKVADFSSIKARGYRKICCFGMILCISDASGWTKTGWRIACKNMNINCFEVLGSLLSHAKRIINRNQRKVQAI